MTGINPLLVASSWERGRPGPHRARSSSGLLLFRGADSDGTAAAFDQSVDRQQDDCPNNCQHQAHQEPWFG